MARGGTIWTTKEIELLLPKEWNKYPQVSINIKMMEYKEQIIFIVECQITSLGGGM